MRHCPTPWTITEQDRNSEALVLDAQGEPVCSVSMGDSLLFNGNEHQDASEVVAEVIHAVNCYDDLIEALELALDYFMALDHSSMAAATKVAIAKATIAKAKGHHDRRNSKPRRSGVKRRSRPQSPRSLSPAHKGVLRGCG